MEETALAYSTIPQTVPTLSDCKFLVCFNIETTARCNDLNETSMGDNHVERNITRGCYLVHNFSHIEAYNQTRVTTVNDQQKHSLSDAQFENAHG